jgi:hypothetical protein
MGLSIIAIQLNHPAGKTLIDAYYLALANETTPEEWQAFVSVAVKRYGWSSIPQVPVLLDALREFRGGTPLILEATMAYDRVIGAAEYNPQRGAWWTYRNIAAVAGKAAAEAFLAAGGNSAFATTWDECHRRERFVAAYMAAAREQPGARLLPEGKPAAELPGYREPSQDEARHLVQRIADWRR